MDGLLIEPVWNRNSVEISDKNAFKLLIEPVWNRNRLAKAASDVAVGTF